ncbi:MAG: glycosyltransferase family 61 protein [Pseudomonadota bacterium]
MPVEDGPGFDLTEYNIPDMRAHFVRDVDGVRILNDFEDKATVRSNDCVHVHDMREVQLNAQFAEDIDICRRKISFKARQSTGFQEEAVCFTEDAYFELKVVRSGDKFLWVSAGSDRLKNALDPNGRHFQTKLDIMTNPQRVPGRNIFFNGVGRGSNYYHWIGEQMPRMALIRKYVDLGEVDSIVVFVKKRVGFIEESLTALFPEFKGQVVQIQGHSAASDEAYFFVQQGLAERSAHPDYVKKTPPAFRASIGSLIDLCEHFDSQASRLIGPKGGYPDVAFISRDRAGQRQWINEDTLVNAVGPRARKVYSEDLSFREQLNTFHHADVIVAQHGAGLANAVFCKPGTRVIEVTARSHARRAWDFAKLGIARGLDYHVVAIDAVLDDPYTSVEAPEEPIPPLYASDLRASDEAIRFIAELCAS